MHTTASVLKLSSEPSSALVRRGCVATEVGNVVLAVTWVVVVTVGIGVIVSALAFEAAHLND